MIAILANWRCKIYVENNSEITYTDVYSYCSLIIAYKMIVCDLGMHCIHKSNIYDLYRHFTGIHMYLRVTPYVVIKFG